MGHLGGVALGKFKVVMDSEMAGSINYNRTLPSSQESHTVSWEAMRYCGASIAPAPRVGPLCNAEHPKNLEWVYSEMAVWVKFIETLPSSQECLHGNESGVRRSQNSGAHATR